MPFKTIPTLTLMKEVLENLLARYQHLSDYADTKLGIIIAFNSAVIFGLFTIMFDQYEWIQYYFIAVIILNIVSIFFAFSGLFAKTKNNHSFSKKTENRNYFYFKYVAQLNEHELLENLKKDYELISENFLLEKDLGNQIVVLAKNANRKFGYFNISLNFTIAAIITPIGLLIFHVYNNPNW